MYKEHKDVSSEESSISNMQEIEAILNVSGTKRAN
jgi:hypothetical protein